MANPKPFGRRGDPLRQPYGSIQAVEALAQSPRIESPRLESLDAAARPFVLPEKSETPSLDDELRRWKRARRQNFEIPWRPLSLMASMSFGIAAFVLPESVNNAVQWPLYALSAASLYAWFRRRNGPRKV
jgi:hypothetical protein